MARNLRQIRVAQGISQEKLAVDAAVDRSYLGGLERQAENPTVDLLDRIAEALAVPMAALFTAPEPNETLPVPLKGGRRRLR